MKKALNNIIKFSVSLGLGFFLVWLAVRNLSASDIAEIKSSFAKANWWLLIAGSSVGFFSNFLRALRWRLLLFPLGYRPGLLNTAHSVNIMYLGNLAFPRLGEVSRCAMLSRYENIPLDKSIGTMITERLIDVVSLLIVGVYLFITQYEILAGYFEKVFLSNKNQGDNAWIKWVIMFIGIAGAATAWLVLKRFSNHPFLKKILELIEGLFTGVKSILQMKNTGLFIFYSVMIWISYALMVYICFFALEETRGLNFNTALALVFFGGFAYIATQGGIGAYPLAVQGVLILYGIGSILGYAFGWIVWVLQTGLVVVLGLLSLILITTTKSKTGSD